MSYKITLIPGDGSGPEVIAAAKRVVEATGVAIEWEQAEAGAAMIEKYGTPLPDETIESIRRNGVALKGPVTTPVGTGFRSVNVAMRKIFDLYANVRPAKTYPGVISRYDNIDLVVVRENTEDLYAGIEHMVGEDAAESIKLITRKGVAIEWEQAEAGAAMIEKYGTPLPDETIESIRRNGVALKGPVTTPVGTGFRSVNVAMRKIFDLYANVRPAKTYPGVISRYDNIDLVVVRENTEDLYAGIEHMVGEDAAESIKLITRKGCERIIRYAFDFAVREGRKKVTAVHKANIMKCTDGMFLDIARQIAKEYPQIEFNDSIVDAMCMRLVMHPEDYDVLVCPNLYGDIVSDLCAGLVGGLGLTPSANIGVSGAIFEPIHGSAPDIAGQHKINPTAAILSASLMLAHLGEAKAAADIEQAVTKVISEGKTLTQDMGGTASTEEFADAVIVAL